MFLAPFIPEIIEGGIALAEMGGEFIAEELGGAIGGEVGGAIASETGKKAVGGLLGWGAGKAFGSMQPSEAEMGVTADVTDSRKKDKMSFPLTSIGMVKPPRKLQTGGVAPAEYVPTPEKPITGFRLHYKAPKTKVGIMKVPTSQTKYPINRSTSLPGRSSNAALGNTGGFR